MPHPAAFLLFLILFANACSRPECSRLCRFRFCRLSSIPVPDPRRILFRDANVASPPFICTKKGKGWDFVNIRNTGEALVGRKRQDPKDFVPISQFRPIGHHFRKNISRLGPSGFQPYLEGLEYLERQAVATKRSF